MNKALRKAVIAGNWKMNKTPAEAKELIAAGSMVGSIKQDAEGMAAAIALLAKNATSGAALMDGTDSYNVDDASAKIRIPYAVYTG